MDRIKEPSSWAGLAALLPVIVRMFWPEWGAVADSVAVAAGSAAVVISEKAK